MNDLLNWHNKSPEEFKEIIEKWAYNEDLYLLEQDEDLLFHDIEWTNAVFDFMFDETCIKRKYIIDNFLDYLQELFLYKKTNEIDMVEKEFIIDMVVYHSHTNDEVIGNCIDYFYSCKTILENRQKPSLEYVKSASRLLLNGKNNSAKVDEPIITKSGNFQVKSNSSVSFYLCFDKENGTYQFSKFYPVCK